MPEVVDLYTDIDSCIDAGEDCTYLNLSSEDFGKSMPNSSTWAKMKHLKHLDMRNSFTGRKRIPFQLTAIPRLESLTLSDNEFSELPSRKALESWNNLVYLNLSNNEFSRIPKRIEALENLDYLDLNNNKLSFISPGIGNLKFLRIFKAMNNSLTSLPEELGNLSEWGNINELWFSNNHLETIPKTLGKLKSLHALYLDGNKLTTLPLSLKNLDPEVVEAQRNKIASLPEGLTIKTKFLANNPITIWKTPQKTPQEV